MSFRKDILVIMTDRHMGNLILAVPAIRSIRESYRDARLHLLVDEAYIEIVETIEGYNLIPYPRRRLKTGSMVNRARTYLGLIHNLREIRPAIAIDLDGREYSSVITFLSGASVRYGPSTSRRAFLYNRKVIFSAKQAHKLHRYLEIASATGASVKESLDLKASNRQRTSLRQKLSPMIETDKAIVCLHPGAGKIYKQWSLEGFARMSDWLSSTKACQVVFIGGDNDIEDVKTITSLTKYPFYNMIGRLSLGELMALFEISSLYIGNDSGPMHLASAMGLSVLALFGPADDRRWGPLSKRSIILRGEEPCQKCKGRHCEHEFRCIRAITFDDVRNVVSELFDLRDKKEIYS
jgi:lipopolysaccharide heptosyltransferase II